MDEGEGAGRDEDGVGGGGAGRPAAAAAAVASASHTVRYRSNSVRSVASVVRKCNLCSSHRASCSLRTHLAGSRARGSEREGSEGRKECSRERLGHRAVRCVEDKCEW